MSVKPYSVRVSIAYDGMSSHRTFTRGTSANVPGIQRFNEWALGSLLAMVMSGYTDCFQLGVGVNGHRIDTTGRDIKGFSCDVVDEANTEESIDHRFRVAMGIDARCECC
jgi:hypothetical protein